MKLFLAALGFAGALAWAQTDTAPDARQRAKTLKDYAAASGVDAKTKVGHIGPYVRDPDVTVQRTAVEALAKIGGAETIDPLVEAARLPDEAVQIRATNAIVSYYYPGYVEQGLTALKARVLGARDPVIEAHIEVRPDVITVLGNLASHGITIPSQANAARAVGVLRGRAALPDLYASLRTKDTRVLYEALVAIRKIGDRDAGPQVTFLLRDLDEDVQVAAIDATGYLQNRAAAPRLRELVVEGRGKRVKPAALAALAQMPDEADRALYEARLNDPDGATRVAAAEGMGRLKRATDQPTVSALFEKEKRMEPRLAAAFASVALGNRALSEFSPLRYLVNTLNSAAYNRIAEAYLEELCRDAANRPAILALIPVMTREEKTRTAGLLGRTGARDVEATLITMSRDADVAVGQAAARALRTLRTQQP